MMRLAPIILTLLPLGCVSHRETPARYSLDTVGETANSGPRLHATIAIPELVAPSWLRTNALVYRLDYRPAPRPIAYSLSEWEAPPGEMLTTRLRAMVREVNDGFTLSRLSSEREGYRLDVSLERFLQVFSRPSESHCIVTMTATLTGPGEHLLAQRTFNAERASPGGNAPGGVHGLAQASNAELEEIVKWVAATLQPAQASGVAR